MQRLRIATWLALAIVVALGVYVIAGPYLTINAIRTAVKQQDAVALSKQVDFPALRASLKIQLGDRLVRKAGPEWQSSALGAFGLSIANGLLGGSVDAMVTPIGLATLMEGRKTWKRFEDGLSSSDAAVPAPEPLHDARYRYESPSRFTATVLDDEGRPVVFVISRNGLRWKLSDIRLPIDTSTP